MAELEQLKGKNWVAAMMLCWTFGLYGGHRFYTGKANSAWIMVALSLLGITLPISMIWMLVDGITIAIGGFRHADGSELYERIPGLGYLYIAMVALGIIFGLLYFGLILAFVSAIVSGNLPV